MAKKSPEANSNVFFQNIVDALKDKNTSFAADGLSAAEFTGYIDTGSYALNALISGTVYGGIPNNKCIAFAGETSTGKTFVMLGVAKHFLDTNPDAHVIYYDTEAAVTKKMMEDRGIATRRVVVVNLPTVQDFQTHLMKLLDQYEEGKTKFPMLVILDSLGALTTIKSLKDATEGHFVKDMTAQQVIRAAFRNIRHKLATVGVPMLVTQHTYAAIGKWGNQQEISGGGGLKYASDDIIMLTNKKRQKEGDEIVGTEIRAWTYKSRLSRENQEVLIKISYDHGLDRYHGLEEIAERGGLNLNKEEVERDWTKILPQIEEIAQKKYSYNVNFGPVA